MKNVFLLKHVNAKAYGACSEHVLGVFSNSDTAKKYYENNIAHQKIIWEKNFKGTIFAQMTSGLDIVVEHYFIKE